MADSAHFFEPVIRHYEPAIGENKIFLLAISIFIIYSVEAQERLFFGNRAIITISKSAIISTTTTLTPTCYELTELQGGGFEVCRRKKRQYGFLVDPFEYYHGDHPQHVTFIQPSAMPDFRYFPLLPQAISNVQPSYEDKTPSLQTSLSEKAEAEGRFFLPKLLTRQTVTSVVTIPTVGSETQSLGIDCTVPGQSIPENVCHPSIVFPPVPDGFTLKEYCQSIGEVAQMAIKECRYAAKRKRSRDGRPVVIVFGRRGGGRFPSRRLISNNILTFCGYFRSCSFPIGFVIDLALVGVPGFPDIIAAGGESSSYVSG